MGAEHVCCDAEDYEQAGHIAKVCTVSGCSRERSCVEVEQTHRAQPDIGRTVVSRERAIDRPAIDPTLMLQAIKVARDAKKETGEKGGLAFGAVRRCEAWG